MMEEHKGKSHIQSIMTKNVTEFRHLIKESKATQNDITWAINLRNYDPNAPKISKQGMAPQVYHKKTKLGQIRQKQFEQEKKKGHMAFKCSEFSHMVPKFNEKTLKHSSSAIEFFSSLRSNDSYSQKQNASKFTCIPYKDKQEKPVILKKTNLKKLKHLNKDDFQTTVDGTQNFPQYSQKILRTKNYGLLKNFTQVRGRGQVSLPGLAWQIGLRNC